MVLSVIGIDLVCGFITIRLCTDCVRTQTSGSGISRKCSDKICTDQTAQMQSIIFYLEYTANALIKLCKRSGSNILSLK